MALTKGSATTTVKGGVGEPGERMPYASAAAGAALGVATVGTTRSFVVLLAPLWVLAAGAEWLRPHGSGSSAAPTRFAALRRDLTAAAGGLVGAFLGGIAAEALLAEASPTPSRLVLASATWGCALAGGIASGLRGAPQVTVFAGAAALATAWGVGVAAAAPQLTPLLLLTPIGMVLGTMLAAGAATRHPFSRLRAPLMGSSELAASAWGGAIAIMMTGIAAASGAAGPPGLPVATLLAALFAATVAAGAYVVR